MRDAGCRMRDAGCGMSATVNLKKIKTNCNMGV